MGVIAYQAATNSWAESTITWNNAPGSTGGSVDYQYVTTGWTEFDVTSAVTGDGTYSFVLKGDDNRTSRDFESSEGTNTPVLEITHNGGGATITLEAEGCSVLNGTISNSGSASGGQYVDFASGGNLNCTYNAAAGNHDLAFTVKRPNSGTRSMGVFVNDVKEGVVSASADSWTTIPLPGIALSSGNNSIELRDSEGTKELDVDKLEITGLGGSGGSGGSGGTGGSGGSGGSGGTGGSGGSGGSGGTGGSGGSGGSGGTGGSGGSGGSGGTGGSAGASVPSLGTLSIAIVCTLLGLVGIRRLRE
jgi:hypothetical protein